LATSLSGSATRRFRVSLRTELKGVAFRVESGGSQMVVTKVVKPADQPPVPSADEKPVVPSCGDKPVVKSADEGPVVGGADRES
jgi:hypothetical protein